MIAVAGTVARDPVACLLHGNSLSPRNTGCGEFYGTQCFQRFMGLSFKGTWSKEINSEKAKMVSDQNSPDLGKYKGCTPPPSIVSEQGNVSRFPSYPPRSNLNGEVQSKISSCGTLQGKWLSFLNLQKKKSIIQSHETPTQNSKTLSDLQR